VNGVRADNGGRGSWKNGAAVLGAIAVASIAGLWLWTRSAAIEAEKKCAREEEKIDKVKKHMAANWNGIFGAAAGRVEPMDAGRVLTIVKDLAAECGLSETVERVDKEENAKQGEVTVKLSFQRVRMADVVNFLALARTRHPNVFDREGRMQAARGEADAWNASVSLTARTGGR
jgi:hypothetical protein